MKPYEPHIGIGTIARQLYSALVALFRMLPAAVTFTLLVWHGSVFADQEFPRLLGMNIGDKHYDDVAYQAQLARMDIVILGFYRGWGDGSSAEPMRDVVRSLKRLNPRLLVGQYTILNEANDDPDNTAEHDKQLKLLDEDWWLKDASGRKVQWTSQYRAWDINITEWARTDKEGRRYPEWLALRDYRTFFEAVPEFDIWYFDNVMAHPRIASADWKREGRNQTGQSPEVQQAFRRAQAAHWERARKLAPKLLFMGNPDNDLSFHEYKGQLQGAFLEGMMGESWSLYENDGWTRMMDRYHKIFDHLAAPRIVGFNVAGKPDDFRLLRFALSSCLMNDGYFSFTDAKRGYSTVPWFDEYDIKLGKPLDPPQTKPWRDGVYRRRFENGMVLVNPGSRGKRVFPGKGYAHFQGKQAARINNGRTVRSVLLAPEDGVLLIRKRR